MNICSYSNINSFDLRPINDRFNLLFKNVCYLLSLTGSGVAGTGTINVGTTNRLTYYAANGTTVSPLAAITASKALASDTNGLPVASATTATELGYVSGVTSAIQTQLNAKQATITTGTTAQYFRGDLSLATFPTTLSLSSLTAATGTNNINNGNFTQTWNFPSLTSGALLINAVSTVMTNSSYVLGILTSGANAASGITSYTADIYNTHTGTTSTNVAMRLTASGGTNNYGLIVAGGKTGLNITTPTSLLHIAAGTATANTAPLKLTTGTALTTPEDGAMEYHSSHLYFTIGSTRYQLDQQSGGGGTWGSITGTLSAQTDLNTALGLKAPLASPTFTGTPLITTTPTTGDNTHKIADTAFVQQELTANTSYFGSMFEGTGTSIDPIVSIAAYNAQTGTTYTLQNSDNGKVVTLNNASGITLTVPASLMAGFNCSIVQLGAGQVTITPSSTTIHNRQSFTKTAGQYAALTILQYTTNTFITQGDMA